MSSGVGHRHGSNPVLLWLWCRPAAVALIQPLAWGLLCAVGVVLKRKKKICQRAITPPMLFSLVLKQNPKESPTLLEEKKCFKEL